MSGVKMAEPIQM